MVAFGELPARFISPPCLHTMDIAIANTRTGGGEQLTRTTDNERRPTHTDARDRMYLKDKLLPILQAHPMVYESIRAMVLQWLSLKGEAMTEPNNYAVFMKNKATGYTIHGEYLLTEAEAQEIADALNKEWPDHDHYVKQEGEA